MRITYSDDAGSSELVQFQANAFHVIARGHLSKPHIQVLLQGVLALPLEEPFSGFWDFGSLDTHASDAQRYADTWGQAYRDRVQQFHMLAYAPIVLMGAHMLNQTFRKIITYQARDAFYAVMERERCQ